MTHLLVIALASGVAGVTGAYPLTTGLPAAVLLAAAMGSACAGVVLAATFGYFRP